jgi:hypothetical protein
LKTKFKSKKRLRPRQWQLLGSDLLRLDHLAATVHTVGADVVTQTSFAGIFVGDHIRSNEGVV